MYIRSKRAAHQSSTEEANQTLHISFIPQTFGAAFSFTDMEVEELTWTQERWTWESEKKKPRPFSKQQADIHLENYPYQSSRQGPGKRQGIGEGLWWVV